MGPKNHYTFSSDHTAPQMANSSHWSATPTDSLPKLFSESPTTSAFQPSHSTKPRLLKMPKTTRDDGGGIIHGGYETIGDGD